MEMRSRKVKECLKREKKNRDGVLNWKFDSEWRKQVFRCTRVRCMKCTGSEIPASRWLD